MLLAQRTATKAFCAILAALAHGVLRLHAARVIVRARYGNMCISTLAVLGAW
jgi:hypothetical protein